MRKNNKLLKTVAVFLLTNLLLEIFAPGISYALTSGPTTPEATTFEPVDGTDLINLITGDLAYSAPFIEVPGPEGSYPLALSYHAGILPDEDASWVGLGWSLNPGAITRNVNGYADDHTSSRINSTVYNDVGGGQGIVTELAGVSPDMGLIYRGHTNTSNGGPVSKKAAYAFFSSGTTASFSHADVVQKTAWDAEQYKLAYNAIYGHLPTGNPTYREHATTLVNMKFPPTYSKAVIVPIPDDPNLNVYLKNNYFRYYYKNLSYVDVTGSVMANQAPAPGVNESTTAFDCYALIDPTVTKGQFNYGKPEEQVGGSFPAYDDYSVSAQGLTGSIKPYIFENGSLFRQKGEDNTHPHYEDLDFKRPRTFTKKVNFRFAGDFSNSLDLTPEQITLTNSLSAPASVSAQSVSSPSTGYNSTSGRLAGSRHIEWYTKEEVANGTAKQNGLISYTNVDDQYTSVTGCGGCSIAKYFDQSTITGHIAAFKITNEAGITYHYALPVYSYDEFFMTGTTSLLATNRLEEENKAPYAYQWMLTAVTGTDYVDRNNNGLVDEADWGYWVAFNYGKWTDKYAWRTPDEGYVQDLNADNSTYSFGRKELYYLDYIKTRTHTALFLKDRRTDGKGVSARPGGYTATGENGKSYVNGSGWNCVEVLNFYPVSPMKLNEVMLLNNSDLNSFLTTNSLANINALKRAGTELDNFVTGGFNQCSNPAGGTPSFTGNFMNLHMGRNVLDIHDVAASNYFTNLRKLSIKSVVLNTDYSLCDGLPNSFDTPTGTSYTASVDANAADPLKHRGKLTLKSIKVLGSGGADIMPVTKYSYDVASPKTYSSMIITHIPGQLSEGAHLGRIDFGPGNHPFVEGDIIRFTINNKQFCAALVKGIPYYNSYNNLFDVIFLGKYNPVNGDKTINAVVTETKNPDYKRDASDMWGMFKSDYNPSIQNRNEAKAVTDRSAKGLDVWSLREVETPMGAKIKLTYEADQYKTPELYTGAYQMNISNVTVLNSQQVTVTFPTPITQTALFPVGNTVDLLAMIQCLYNDASNNDYVNFVPFRANGVVSQVNTSSIIITSPAWVTALQSVHCEDPVPNMPPPVCTPTNFINSVIGGNIKGVRPVNISGGGIRLKSVEVAGSGISSEVSYSYESSSGITSGVTTYEPVYTDLENLTYPISAPGITTNEMFKQRAEGKAAYKNFLVQSFDNILKNAREIPGPGVMYEFVTMKEKVNGNAKPVSTKYQFEVFHPYMVKYESTYYNHEAQRIFTGFDYSTYNRMVRIKNYTSRIGVLKNIFTYDNNNKLVAKVSNTYLHDHKSDAAFETDLAGFSNQGMVKQSFNEVKLARNKYCLAVTSTREEYPAIHTVKETHDFVKGFKNADYIKAYDFYSGAVTKTWRMDSYNNYILTENVPAYQKYPEMGLKVNTVTNRNMLTPSTASYTYKTDSYGNITGTLSASVNTWSKECNYRTNFLNTLMTDDVGTVQNEQVWRPKASYVWHSPMLHPDGSYQNFVDFDWGLEASAQPQHKFWQKNSDIILYDYFSNALEAKDVNGNYITSKIGYNNSRILANAVNARYTEILYTGAEDPLPGSSTYFEGEIYGQTFRNSTYAHTGKYALRFNQNQSAELHKVTHNSNHNTGAAIMRQKKYKASVWVHKDNITQARLSYTITYGAAPPQTITSGAVTGNTSLPKCGDWYLLSMEFDTGNPIQTEFDVRLNLIHIGGNANPVYFDDFRFHPVESSISTYVYDLKTQMVTHILDNNNFYTRFEYDPYGRLIATYKETIDGEKKMSDNYYNYARKP